MTDPACLWCGVRRSSHSTPPLNLCEKLQPGGVYEYPVQCARCEELLTSNAPHVCNARGR